MIFSERLETHRTERGLNKTELAKELHISGSTLSGYLHGKREPDYHTLSVFADYFNVSVDYLIGRSETRNPFPKSVNKKEDTLLHLFRSMNETGQDLLMEQAQLYTKRLK
jgi:transcriptional regulator with XRE-family HTH domain